MLISIHAPTRGATSRSVYSLCHYAISIHAPTRGATMLSVFRSKAFGISIHAPTRGATVRVRWIYCSKCISIHAPTRGATFLPVKKEAVQRVFQSTLPRGERRKFAGSRLANTKFQSTLPRGERPQPTHYISKSYTDFNPRSHEGSDCTYNNINKNRYFISIHAPTRGATRG